MTAQLQLTFPLDRQAKYKEINLKGQINHDLSPGL